MIGEQAVDPQVSGQIGPAEFGKVDPVVQNGPEHPVGEAVVIFLVVGILQVGDHIGHLVRVRSSAVPQWHCHRPCRSSRTRPQAGS